MSANAVSLFKGDTLVVNGVYKDSSGTPVNLTTAGISIAASYMTPDGLTTAPVTVTLAADQTANAGQFTLTADTGLWPDWGEYSIKLSYTQGGVTFSDRFGLRIEL